LAEKVSEPVEINLVTDASIQVEKKENQAESEYRQSLSKILNPNDIKQLEMFLIKSHPRQFIPKSQEPPKPKKEIEVEPDSPAPSQKSLTQKSVTQIQKTFDFMPISNIHKNLQANLESTESLIGEHAMEIEAFDKPQIAMDFALESNTNN